MNKKKAKASRRPRHRTARAHHRKVQYARVNPGVSTLMLINPAEAQTVHKGIESLSRKLARLEHHIKSASPPSGRRKAAAGFAEAASVQSKGEPMARKRARPSRKRAKHKPSVELGRVIERSVQAAVQGVKHAEGRKKRMSARKPTSTRHQPRRRSHSAPRRGPDGRFLRDGTPNIHYLKRNKTPSDRGLIALGRAHRSIRWERENGKPDARQYVSRHFAAVNPSMKGFLHEQGGQMLGALAGFYGARALGNLAPRLPVVGGMLGGWSRVLGSAGVAALGYFFFPKRFARQKASFLSGAALALVDAVLRQMVPSLQGVLGEGPADIAAGQLPAGAEQYQLPAAGCTEPAGEMGSYVPEHTSGYVSDQTGNVPAEEMSGYVQTHPVGDADDGMNGFWEWVRARREAQTVAHPVVHRSKTHPYRIVVDCPYPPQHLVGRLPPGARIVEAHPPEVMRALPPAQQAHAAMAPVMPAHLAPAPKKGVSGGIFADND